MSTRKSTGRVHPTVRTLQRGITGDSLEDYVAYLSSPGRVVWTNLLAGIARGFGLVIGATLVVTIVTVVISQLSGIPIIGQFFIWMQSSLHP